MTGIRAYWDEQAATFDDEVDHGLVDAVARDAWREVLLRALPPPPADVVDLGCGTGTLSVLLAQAGYSVRGWDLSPRMLDTARRKAVAAGVDVPFRFGDAARPDETGSSCDVVLVRHVLWAMPDPAAALGRWARLLRPGGRLVLVEGRWDTGGGVGAAECQALVQALGRTAQVQHLTDPALWGRVVADERYVLVSRA